MISTRLSLFQAWLYLDQWWWWQGSSVPPQRQTLCWWGDAPVGSTVLVRHDYTLCCLQCDAGEQCAVRKGARIGKLCDCPRGTSCNSFSWSAYEAPTFLISPSPLSPGDHTLSLESGFSNGVCISPKEKGALSSCCFQIKRTHSMLLCEG